MERGCGLGRWPLLHGAVEPALSRAVDLSDRIGLAEPAMWRFHANHVEAVIGLGDLDRAERLLGRFEGWGRATGRAWTLATAARCRSLLLAARGDMEDAVQALEEAMRHHQDLAMPFEFGRTLLVMGQVQRRPRSGRNSTRLPAVSAARSLATHLATGSTRAGMRARSYHASPGEVTSVGGRT